MSITESYMSSSAQTKNEESKHLEQCPCLLCSSKEAYPVEQFGKYQILRCECGFVYQSPRLKETAMREYYESSSYYSGEGSGYSDYEKQEYGLRKTFRKFLKNLTRKGHSGGSLLEIGCGWGYLLDEAREYFSTRWGTEYNQEAVLKAQQFADRIICGGLENVPSEDMDFDCIILNQVIEHIYNPVEFSRKLHRFLKPDGIVVMATPNIQSPIRYFMGKKWPSYKVPEHVSYFSQSTLQRLFQEAGFVDITPLSYSHAFPLSLIASKFGIQLPTTIGKRCLWVPTTTTCCLAKSPEK